tara:strand:- start:498 stop:683 length:186 start_codon:yes stop_codon:yes gene_type:complete
MNILKILLSIIIIVLATGGVVLILADQTIGEFDIIQFILVKIYGFGILILAYYLNNLKKTF